MTPATLTALGVVLLATTPNTPGSPTDPALHPAAHLVLGALAMTVGIVAGLRRWVL